MNKSTNPPGCDQEIFNKGEYICIVKGNTFDIEKWVKLVATQARAKVDWHWHLAGEDQANIMHLGDKSSLIRVLLAIKKLKGELKGELVTMECTTGI